jgi:hypothetical protein
MGGSDIATEASAIGHQDRLLALMCLVLAVAIAMPIPFANLLPGICVLLMALGMVQRDGLFAAGGLAGGLLLLCFGAFAGNAIVTRLLAAWPLCDPAIAQLLRACFRAWLHCSHRLEMAVR